MRGPYGPPPWAAFGARAARMAAELAAEAAGHRDQGAKCGPGGKFGPGGPKFGPGGPKFGPGGRFGPGGDFGWVFGGGGPWGPPRGGPWGPGRPPWAGGWRGQRARKGNVRAAILALLAEEPRNGYQIIQEIGERSGGGWKPSPGAVYPALQQLADEGLIAAEESGGGRKTFSLTDEGRTYVEEHADELGGLWEEMTPEFGAGVPDLLKLAAQTGGALMQIVHTGSAEQVAQAQKVLSETRKRLYRILAEEDADPAPDEEG